MRKCRYKRIACNGSAVSLIKLRVYVTVCVCVNIYDICILRAYNCVRGVYHEDVEDIKKQFKIFFRLLRDQLLYQMNQMGT